jgi:hypothetical protein
MHGWEALLPVRVRAQQLHKMLAEYGVLVLYSPPYDPEYNESCEAGVGSMKTQTQEHAERASQAAAWTLEDAEGSQCVQCQPSGTPAQSTADVTGVRAAAEGGTGEVDGAGEQVASGGEGKAGGRGEAGGAGQETNVTERSWRVVLRLGRSAISSCDGDDFSHWFSGKKRRGIGT